MKRSRLYIKTAAAYFIFAGIFAVILLTERPRSSRASFEENVRPGRERLFVRLRTEIADSLFTDLTGGGRKTAEADDGRFTVKHPGLGARLAATGMGDGLWNELSRIDPGLVLSKDGNELQMSMGEDEVSGEEFVWVPAGILSLFIK